MEKLLQKLDGLTKTWKKQCICPFPEGIPLKWEIRNGIVFLDGIWIAPASFIRTEKLDQYDDFVYMETIQLPMADGSLEVTYSPE